MATAKKTPIRKARTTAKKVVKRVAVSRKKKQAEMTEGRVFALTVGFTVLALVFLWFALMRVSL